MSETITFDPDADDQKLLAQVIAHYHATFKTSIEAQAFLQKRGIANAEAIDHFRIGYSDYSLQSLMPSFLHKAGKVVRARLSAMGLLQSRSHQAFKGCIVFPVTAADGSGEVVDMYARRVAKASDTRCPRHRYMSKTRRGIWNVEAIAENDVVILCSSVFDALTFWNAGFRNVTCTFSPNAMADDHLAAFREFSTRRVLLVDEAMAPRLLEAGLECFLLPFPQGVDPNKFVLKSREQSQSLGTIIQKAVALGKGSTARPKFIAIGSTTQSSSPRQPGPTDARSETGTLTLASDDDQKLLAQVIDYYQRTLKQNPEGLNYLQKRGITGSEALDVFRIGYCDRTLCECLPSPHVKTGKEIRKRLQHVGVNRGSGHEHLAGCVVFPILAADGSNRILDIYGRMIGTQLRKGTVFDKHLNDERRGVWNIQALRAGQEIILLSSLFDALTFWSNGYRNVTCMFGSDALTDDLMGSFIEFGIRRLLVTSETVAPKLLAAGIDVYLMRFPQGMDANKYAGGFADASRALGEVIRRAEWIGNGRSNRSTPAVSPSSASAEQTPASVTPSPAEPLPPPAAPTPSNTLPDFDDELDDVDEELDALDDAELDDDLEHDDIDKLVELGEESQVAEKANELSVPAEPVLAASPLPSAPQVDEADQHGDEVVLNLGHRRYRVRGLAKNLSFDQLKVNLLASSEQGMFVDTFDLYTARHRRQFIVQAAVELGVEENTIKKDLGRVLLKLEELQDEQIARMMEPKDPLPTMTPEERENALRLLRGPHLLDRIIADFDVVGETNNKLVGYLAAISRKLDQPLAVIIQSSSAAGKTSLMEAVLSFVPPEDHVKYSAMTGQSLFYMGETNLKHKILAIIEEEGAERASYALKLLQSEGELMIASTGKDASSGRLVTQEYRVEGPVMIFLTTTAIKIDEELLNRCIVLSVDENREQTKAIHQLQRRRQTLAGLLAVRDRQDTLAVHRNAQRLLRPLLVANPFAESLTFLDDKTRTRRDHVKYLTLIQAIALLDQYQRPVKTVAHGERQIEYIEATLDDIAMANRLASEALGRSVDELPPQTRRLLTLVDDMVQAACEKQDIDRADHRFSRREVREFTGWGHTQLKIHLKRLEELEYLLVHRGGRGQSFVYELLYEPPPDASKKFLARLIDVEQLRHEFDGNWSVVNGQLSGHGRPQVMAKSASSRAIENDVSAAVAIATHHDEGQPNQNANLDAEIPF
jgi:DNA primase